MKILKRVLAILCICIVSAVFTGAAVLLLVGAVKCASSFIGNTIPTELEYVGFAFIMLAGGVIAAILYYFDTKENG